MGEYGDTLFDMGFSNPNKYNVMMLVSKTSIPKLLLQNGVFVPEADYSLER